MTCRCGFEWCWICHDKWSRQHSNHMYLNTEENEEHAIEELAIHRELRHQRNYAVDFENNIFRRENYVGPYDDPLNTAMIQFISGFDYHIREDNLGIPCLQNGEDLGPIEENEKEDILNHYDSRKNWLRVAIL
jgi:hypothetical protein